MPPNRLPIPQSEQKSLQQRRFPPGSASDVQIQSRTPASKGMDPKSTFLVELEDLMAHEFFGVAPKKSFIYKQLPANGAIRLLALEAGFKDSPLCGSLKQVNINKLPRYEALSYCWGSPDKPRSIELDNGTINITESLYSALVRLRRLTKSRLIWADALCINQDDNIEKNYQILLMQQIYSSAFRTLAYLGDEADGSDSAIKLHEQIGGISFSALPEKSVTTEWLKAQGLPEYQDASWLAWSIFWRRPWFRRAWVLQEFVLGKDIVIICGRKKLNWKKFVSASEKMQEFNLLRWSTSEVDTYDSVNEAHSGAATMFGMMAVKSNSSLSSGIAYYIRSFSEADESDLQQLEYHNSLAEKLPGLKDFIMDLRKDPSMVEPVIKMLEETMGAFGLSELTDPTIHLPLINLVLMFDKSEATDPRDRLFSLLGLAADGSDDDFRPDYNESVESVARRFSLGFIQKGYGMKVLHLAGLSDEVQSPSWPSWVPDWTRPGVMERRVLCARTLWAPSTAYKAGADLAPSIRISQNSNVLLVSGSRVDTISRLGMDASGISSRASSDVFVLKPFLDEADDIICPDPSKVYAPTGESRHEVYWRTLIANRGKNWAEATEDYAFQYEECRRFFDTTTIDSLTSIEQLLSLNLYFACVVSLLLTSRVGTSENGFVGLVPMSSQIGDLICVFNGGAMPFIIRPSAEIEGMFRLIGGCYIHGLMRGEALRSPKWKVEDFSFH
ncbi:HET-domain-containing protein [Cadophora sp. DSE1049]|nr:HET-domain-containing protein [Cadophora sp. DSE1049]